MLRTNASYFCLYLVAFFLKMPNGALNDPGVTWIQGRFTLGREIRVHRVRCQIDLARPRNGSLINEDLPEKILVAQGRKGTG